jgi:ubiquitin-protein ligase
LATGGVFAADLTELSLPSNIHINFPEGKEKPMHFEITIKPDEGYYRSGKFLFDFQISTGYPYDAPKVKCKTKVRAAEPHEIRQQLPQNDAGGCSRC